MATTIREKIATFLNIFLKHLLQHRKPAWKERINKSADPPVSWQLIAAVLT
jgi:hypothetical protein